MDRGAWRAAIHSVAKSQTRLKRRSMHACVSLKHRLQFPGNVHAQLMIQLILCLYEEQCTNFKYHGKSVFSPSISLFSTKSNDLES